MMCCQCVVFDLLGVSVVLMIQIVVGEDLPLLWSFVYGVVVVNI